MMGTIKKTTSSVILLGMLTLWSGCIPTEPEYTNQRDPVNPDFITPEIEDITITYDYDNYLTIIEWRGNSVSDAYQYKLDDGRLSSWTRSTSIITLPYPEEGSEHTFSVRSRLDNLYVGSLKEITFPINIIEGPGIVFSPRRVTRNSAVTVYLENVKNLMGAHIEITCSGNCADLGDFQQNDYTPGNIVVYSENLGGTRLVIDLAYLGGSSGITTNTRIEIGSFHVTLLGDGEITIDSEKTVLRNVDNNDISINGLDKIRVYK